MRRLTVRLLPLLRSIAASLFASSAAFARRVLLGVRANARLVCPPFRADGLGVSGVGLS